MESPWRWQEDGLWQSCSPAAVERAQAWLENPATLHEKLTALAAQQPLISVDDQVLRACNDHSAALRAVSQQLVVIGTGGASLGAQALCALAEDASRVRFLENCDPVTLASFLKLPKDQVSWCIISKSGETVETLAAALSLIAHYVGDDALLKPRVRVITSAHDSTLSRLATAQGWAMLEHPATLGGRFSVFSTVGLFPAAYSGLDIAALAEEARRTRTHYLQAPHAMLLSHAAWFAANLPEKPMHVLMAYADRLRPSTQWYKQLWAESLGKQGAGPTPITAIGALDQHSQLQLYLDGPRDKLMTLWLPEVSTLGAELPKLAIAGLDYLAGSRMGQVMQATAEATVTTLTKARVPLRVARGDLTPQSLAAWMMRSMLETLAVAALLEVDPYSQPAVEEGKHLARAALRGTS